MRGNWRLKEVRITLMVFEKVIFTPTEFLGELETTCGPVTAAPRRELPGVGSWKTSQDYAVLSHSVMPDSLRPHRL